ncbi:MAG: efflux RND transporter periplasmic adaptor subunit [Chitinophagales bacterium]|nr:efflux RND transporter periplasmic adaptor subunit [Chitinophagales bacterium]
MKKLLLISAMVSFLAACSHSGAGDKQAELDSLKKQRQEIDDRIKKLESEIGTKPGTASEKAQLVAVAEVQPTLFEHYIEIQGKVDAEENVTVTPQMPGTIEKVNVVVGQKVKKGQVLAQVDGATIQAQIDALEKNLELATTLYEKQKSLWEQNIGTEVQYLQSKNQKESLEKQLNTLKQQFELTKLISPINGVVDAVDVKVGQMGSPGLAGIRVVNSSNLKVKGEVSENYSLQVHEGDKVVILFPDLNKEVESKISYSSKVINPQSRSFTIEAKLPGQEGYKPNMIAVVKILDYEKKDAMVAEVNHIQKSGDGQYIYVAAEENGRNIAKRQPVTVGKIYGGIAEITSGLKSGDKVITVGYQDIVAGQPVQY